MKWLGWTILGVFSAGILAAVLVVRRRLGGSVTGGDDRVGPDGVVPGDPGRLASAAGLTLDEYALARLMESEETNEAARVGIGWAARNMAQGQDISVAKLLLRGKGKGDGKFGRQDIGGKYAATSKPPTAATMVLAKKIMAKAIPDPTGGAKQWDAPKAQDALHARDPAKYKSAAEIAERRQAAGNVLVMLPGVTSTRFWRPGKAKA